MRERGRKQLPHPRVCSEHTPIHSSRLRPSSRSRHFRYCREASFILKIERLESHHLFLLGGEREGRPLPLGALQRGNSIGALPGSVQLAKLPSATAPCSQRMCEPFCGLQHSNEGGRGASHLGAFSTSTSSPRPPPPGLRSWLWAETDADSTHYQHQHLSLGSRGREGHLPRQSEAPVSDSRSLFLKLFVLKVPHSAKFPPPASPPCNHCLCQ